jgi:hypothetical protein
VLEQEKKGDIFFIKNDDGIACFDLHTQTIEDMGVKGESFCCHFAIYKKNLLRFADLGIRSFCIPSL